VNQAPVYPKVVVGYEESERGEDARVLAERVVERDGGELKVVHVERGSPADALRASRHPASPMPGAGGAAPGGKFPINRGTTAV
jgi:hypothetical protein